MSQIIQDFNLILAERKLENERFKQDEPWKLSIFYTDFGILS